MTFGERTLCIVKLARLVLGNMLMLAGEHGAALRECTTLGHDKSMWMNHSQVSCGTTCKSKSVTLTVYIWRVSQGTGVFCSC